MYGAGGTNRTTQLEEFLRDRCNVSEIIDVDFASKTSLIQRIKAVFVLLIKHKFKIKASKWLIMWSAHSYCQYATCFRENLDASFFLLEEPPSFIAYHAAKDFGLKIILGVHNLETMVSSYTEDFFLKKPYPFSLFREIEYIKKADLVLCISREEQWLLRSFNIESHYFPYTPPKKLNEYYQKIREQRLIQNNIDSFYTIVSTIHNPATLKSLSVQLDELNQINKQITSFKVLLIGYGLEIHKIELEKKYSFLVVEGTVDSFRMEQILQYTKAVLIYQNEGVGAITKIPEYLIAGIPIIANTHAARSAYNFEGLMAYDVSSELKDLILRSSFPVFKTPMISEKLLEYISKRVLEISEINIQNKIS